MGDVSQGEEPPWMRAGLPELSHYQREDAQAGGASLSMTATTSGSLRRRLLVGFAALAVASALRLVDGWDDGALWVPAVLLVAVAALATIGAVLAGVRAVGEGVRRPRATTHRAWSAVGLALAVVLGVATAYRGATDWYDLDVPAAWERLEFGSENNLHERLDDARSTLPRLQVREPRDGVPPVAGGTLACYRGTVDDPGGEVPCDELHRTELYLSWKSEGAEVLPSDCTTPEVRDESGEIPEGSALWVISPSSPAWSLGDDAACALQLGEAVAERVTVAG